MLQILGWLGCLYLFVKGLEIIGDQTNRVKTWDQLVAEETFRRTGKGTVPNPPETRRPLVLHVAAWTAIIGAVVFAFMLSAQASQISTAQPPVPVPY